MPKYTRFIDENTLRMITGKKYTVKQDMFILEITPVDDTDSDAQSILDTLLGKMGVYKLADEHEEKALEDFRDGKSVTDAVTRRG